MISSVCSGYSITPTYFIAASKYWVWLRYWIRPRFTRCSASRFRFPPRKMVGAFSFAATIMAAARFAIPGPWVPKQTPGLPVMRDHASAMKPPHCS